MAKRFFIIAGVLSLAVGVIAGGRFLGIVGVRTDGHADAKRSVTLSGGKNGAPRVNFSDGFESVADAEPESNGSSGRALASGDFDSDGVADLVTGDSAGVIRFHKGNSDSIYFAGDVKAKAGERLAEPFAAANTAIVLSIVPDYLEAGDFNADGNLDLLAARIGDKSLHLLAGNGAGEFSASQPIEFDGAVTAMATGEIGRADGQTDVAIAVAEGIGNRLLVFEHPTGAFSRKPETILLPSRANEIVLGFLESDGFSDIVAVGGNQLTLVRGRGQVYPWDMIEDQKLDRPAPIVETRMMPFRIEGVAVGYFTERRGQSLALLSDSGEILIFDQKPREIRPLPDSNMLSKMEISKPSPEKPDRSQVFSTFREYKEPLRPLRDESELMNHPEVLPGHLRSLEEIESYRIGLAEKRFSAIREMTPEARAERIAADRKEAEESRQRTKRNFLNSISPAPAASLADWELASIAGDVRLAAVAGSRQVRKLVKVRVSDSGRDELALTDAPANKVHLLIRENLRRSRDPRAAEIISLDMVSSPTAMIPMRLNMDAVNDLVVLRDGSPLPTTMLSRPATVFTVDTLTDEDDGSCDSPCSLREAIEAANNNTGTDSIEFSVTGTMQPTFALPEIEFPVTINGPNGASPQVEINGALTDEGDSGLRVNAANVVIRRLSVTGFRRTPPDPDGATFGGQGITIYNFAGSTIAGFNIVEGCYLGTGLSGTSDKGNQAAGLQIFDSDNNTIGGTTPAARNVISGNGSGEIRDSPITAPGVMIIDGRFTILRGNYIGTNAAGTAALPNSAGVFAAGANNEYGGDAAGSMNVISGNRHLYTIPNDSNGCTGRGLYEATIFNDATGEWVTRNNNIRGNRVGTNAAGTAAIGNCRTGIYTSPRTSAIIGSITAGGRNLASGNDEGGIFCTLGPPLVTELPFLATFGKPQLGDPEPPTGLCTIRGNTVGTNALGTAAIPNSYNHVILQGGINILSPLGGLGVNNTESYSTIGDPGGTSSTSCTGFCNLVSGETTTAPNALKLDTGIAAVGNGNIGVFNNYTGVNVTGTAALPNGEGGIAGNGSVTIGTIATGTGGSQISLGNLVSGNLAYGIGLNNQFYTGGTGLGFVRANLVGTDRTGISAIPNGNGVFVTGGSGGVLFVGGAQPAEGNVIAGNSGYGLFFQPGSGSSAAARNNRIGVNINGQPLGNGGDGVILSGTFNYLGDEGAGNIIANNGGSGVLVRRNFTNSPEPVGNRIKYNSIYNNGGLGIDLTRDTTLPIEGDGVTPNDCLDPDDGPHGLQNYPILTVPRFNGDGTVTVGGAFGSKPNGNDTIDFYSNSTEDPSEYGEGETYIGSTAVTTAQNGIASFLFTSTIPVAPGLKITATAYDIDGNTSEFSCFAGQCSISGATLEEQIESARAAVGDSGCRLAFEVNINTDQSDPNPADGICDVDLGTTGEQCSLRAAIQTTNAIPGTDIINFNIPGGGVQIITPQDDLPAITDRTVLNGATQPGYLDKPRIQLNGDAVGVATGLNFAAGSSNSTVDAFSVNGFDIGLKLASDGNTVKRSYIGLDADGVTIPPSGSRQFVGIEITGKNNTVGGERDSADPANGNSYVTGNVAAGVQIRTANATGNRVIGTSFGFIDDPKGTPPANITLSHIEIRESASENTIGSLEMLERNLIINADTGIDIVESAHDNLVIGNIIADTDNGIFVGGANNNTIGGDHDSGARNFLVSNGFAIMIGYSPASSGLKGKRLHRSDAMLSKMRTGTGSELPSVGNKIYGNVIGISQSGDPFLGPNDYGIAVALAENTLIGSGTFGRHNFVSNSQLDGIVMTRDATGTKVKGNFIGTDITGQGIAANQNGVTIYGSNNEVTNNVVSGNNNSGLIVSTEFENDPRPRGNLISNNRIGTNGAGTIAIPNGLEGVYLGGDENTLSGNVISGNETHGGRVFGNGNQITGNKFGTNEDGDGAIPNAKDGLAVFGNANRIAGNTISGNSRLGLGIARNAQNDPAPDGNIVVGNKIGTNSEGTAALPNSLDGIVVLGAANTLIGGFGTDIPADRNLVSGNGRHGILIAAGSTATRVSGNYIGVNASGTASIPNLGAGIRIGKSSSGTIIGGSEPNAGNMIGFNAANGIDAGADPPLDPLTEWIVSPERPMAGGGLSISANYIGVVLTGGGLFAPGGNGGNGVSVDNFPGVVIGGDGASSGNLIGANVAAGIKITNAVPTAEVPVPVQVRGNNIGAFFDNLGNLAGNLGNALGGVRLENSAGVEIGGTTGNLIANNGGNGLFMSESSQGTIRGNTVVKNVGPGLHLYRSSTTNIAQNAIGVVKNLGQNLPESGNAGDGVLIEESPGNTIGGSVSSSFNQIGKNLNNAIRVLNTHINPNAPVGATGPTEIQGNLLGAETTSFGGTVSRASNAVGVLIENSSQVKIGGNTSTTGNSIVANNGVGVRLTGSLTRLVSVTNNVIGKLAEHHGTTSDEMGNGDDGISIGDGANDNTIGGGAPEPLTTGTSSRNVITANGANGIRLDPTGGSNNYIANNSIFGNSAIGIDIGSPGLNPNDPTDSDAGPNNLQNYPAIVSVQIVNEELVIGFRVDSSPAHSNYGANGLLIEFFKADPSGEGERLIGNAFYTVADYNSLAPGTKTVNLGNINALGIGTGDQITATATDSDGNTSEFSALLAPTSASVSVSGRVRTASGEGIRNAVVRLTSADGSVLTTRTGSFGYFRFEAVEAGQTVIVSVRAKIHSFAPRTVNLEDTVTDLELVSDP